MHKQPEWHFACAHQSGGVFPGHTTKLKTPSSPVFWSRGMVSKEISLVLDISLGVEGEGLLGYRTLAKALNPPPGSKFQMKRVAFYGKNGGSLSVKDLLSDESVFHDDGQSEPRRQTAIVLVPSHGVRKHWATSTSNFVPYAVREHRTDGTKQRVTVCSVVELWVQDAFQSEKPPRVDAGLRNRQPSHVSLDTLQPAQGSKPCACPIECPPNKVMGDTLAAIRGALTALDIGFEDVVAPTDSMDHTSVDVWSDNQLVSNVGFGTEVEYQPLVSRGDGYSPTRYQATERW
jgi:hypothetical protein